MSERDELRGIVARVITNVSMFPKQAQPGLLGSDMSAAIDAVTGAIKDSGFRCNEVIVEWGAAHAGNGVVSRSYRTRAAAQAFVDSMAEVGYEMVVLRREYLPASYSEWEPLQDGPA